MSEELAGLTGESRYYEMSRRMERAVLDAKGL
jgi:hypothetical protein